MLCIYLLKVRYTISYSMLLIFDVERDQLKQNKSRGSVSRLKDET